MDTQLTVRQMKLTHWAGIIRACRTQCSSGGMEVRQWLQDNGISKDQYYYWHKKVKEAALTSSCGETFCELRAPEEILPVPHAVSDCAVITVSTGSFTISVPEGSSREALRIVLEEVSHVK